MDFQRDRLSVSQLNQYLKMLMDGDPILSRLSVWGEISNFKAHSSGHFYFSLKDAQGQLRCVMFASSTARLKFLPEDGMRVIVRGRVSVYGASGQYQLYAEEIQPDGAGALALQLEQLKRKLAAEGLFDETRKRALPKFPDRIGVITSPTGAAVQDIRHVLGRRYPMAEMLLFPSAAQGEEAPEQLIMGLSFFAQTRAADVIIIGRGGGSAEDLWAFNDERLVRAVASSPIPVISAVGHESDFTLCDFAADRRAPTPSAAAELAVPDANAVFASVRSEAEKLQNRMRIRLQRDRQMLDSLTDSRIFRMPMVLLDEYRMRLAEQERVLGERISETCASSQHALVALAGRLEALNPLSVLTRGYAVVYRDQTMLTRARSVRENDTVRIRFADGDVYATVQKGGPTENG